MHSYVTEICRKGQTNLGLPTIEKRYRAGWKRFSKHLVWLSNFSLIYLWCTHVHARARTHTHKTIFLPFITVSNVTGKVTLLAHWGAPFIHFMLYTHHTSTKSLHQSSCLLSTVVCKPFKYFLFIIPTLRSPKLDTSY